MKSNGTYMRLEKFETKDEVFEFINDSTKKFSNYEKYDGMVQKLVNYKLENAYSYKERKTGTTYKTIFADKIKVAIPQCLDEWQYEEFIKKYLLSFDVRLKNLLWIAKIVKEGKGTYFVAMVFSRGVYSKPVSEQDTYDQDYYYKNGRRCSPDNPDGVLKRKKGELKFNKDGTPVMITRTVQRVEERIFRVKNIYKLTEKFKKLIVKVANEMCEDSFFPTKISKHTITDDCSKSLQNSFRKRNRFIDTIINEKLIRFQEGIIKAKIDETEEDIFAFFDELVEKVDSILFGNSGKEFNNLEGIMDNWWEQNILGYSIA